MSLLIELDDTVIDNGKVVITSPTVNKKFNTYSHDPYILDHTFTLNGQYDDIPYIDKTVVFTSLIEGGNYAHFLTLTLPSLIEFILKERSYDLIYSATSSVFANDVYKALNIQHKIISTPIFRAKKVICFQASTEFCWPNENDILKKTFDFLRSKFITTNTQHDKCVYIRRCPENSDDKFILNENELLDILPEHNIFDAKGYTLAQQAQLFHEANIIIGPFGASLTNTMFCKPGTFILEFRHKSDLDQEWYNKIYRNTPGLKHCVAYADAIAPSNYNREKRCDFNVDTDKVKQILSDLPIHSNYVDTFSRDDVLSQMQ